MSDTQPDRRAERVRPSDPLTLAIEAIDVGGFNGDPGCLEIEFVPLHVSSHTVRWYVRAGIMAAPDRSPS